VLLASLDTQRPAAQLQLAQLAERAGVLSCRSSPARPRCRSPAAPWRPARREGFDVVILDTAGRLSIDEALMDEVRAIRAATNPAETLLVVDAMTGQDAVNTAKAFNDALGVTGIVLTRMDGDARGGAALSMRAHHRRADQALRLGEKLDALEDFHPERVAGRILGMGDIVGLVERAAETIDQDEAEKLAKKMMKGPSTWRITPPSSSRSARWARSGHPRHAARHGQDQASSWKAPTSIRRCSSASRRSSAR
jgi:signal recognition particle subunit SRP54